MCQQSGALLLFALTIVMLQMHCSVSTSPANAEWQEFVLTLAVTHAAAPFS